MYRHVINCYHEGTNQYSIVIMILPHSWFPDAAWAQGCARDAVPRGPGGLQQKQAAQRMEEKGHEVRHVPIP